MSSARASIIGSVRGPSPSTGARPGCAASTRRKPRCPPGREWTDHGQHARSRPVATATLRCVVLAYARPWSGPGEDSLLQPDRKARGSGAPPPAGGLALTRLKLLSRQLLSRPWSFVIVGTALFVLAGSVILLGQDDAENTGGPGTEPSSSGPVDAAASPNASAGASEAPPTRPTPSPP